jgi:UDP-2-acetamido-3-amino-2,3-dideoxy-glucuronate N-acetyltransferase
MADAPPFIHDRALCESDDVGAGARIWAFAHVMKGAHIGRDCNICDHAFVESGGWIGDGVTLKNGVMVWNGVRIGDGVFVGPGVVFTNDLRPRSPRSAETGSEARYADEATWLSPTEIAPNASIGARAVILPGITIGAFAMVAAGAVVTKNTPAHALVAGNPARIIGHVGRTGAKLLSDGKGVWRCPDTDERYLETPDGLTREAG